MNSRVRALIALSLAVSFTGCGENQFGSAGSKTLTRSVAGPEQFDGNATSNQANGEGLEGDGSGKDKDRSSRPDGEMFDGSNGKGGKGGKGGNGGSAQVTAQRVNDATVRCNSTKDLSNVVLEFSDGSRERFEGLNGLSAEFKGTGANAGKKVTAVWIKSGSNHSGDGPGYGERVEL